MNRQTEIKKELERKKVKSLKETEAEKYKWRIFRKRQKMGTCVRLCVFEGERNEA